MNIIILKSLQISPLGISEITYIPRILHVPRKSIIPLEALGYVDRFEKWIPISLLNLNKLSKITVLLSSLDILISDELWILLKTLSEISDKNTETINTSELSLLETGNDIFYLNEIKLIDHLKREIFANIPDIDALNMQEVMELMGLLDKLDVTE